MQKGLYEKLDAQKGWKIICKRMQFMRNRILRGTEGDSDMRDVYTGLVGLQERIMQNRFGGEEDSLEKDGRRAITKTKLGKLDVDKELTEMVQNKS